MKRVMQACVVILLLQVLTVGGVQAAHEHGAGMGARPPVAATAAFDARGVLWLARVADDHVWLSRSADRGGHYGAPVRVNAEPEPIAADGENRPKLAFGRDGELFVSWTRRLEQGKYAGHVRFARSLDGGRSFSAPVTVNDDRAPISHRFDALAVDGDGRVHVLWLDRRDAAAADARQEAFAGISLYHAVSADAGATFTANRRLVEHSCECCRIAIAADTDGTPVIVWRHVFGANVRDHALLRLDGHSSPQRVSEDQWAIDACPHHGPGLAVDARGRYHVAWFTGGALRQGLFYARSDDRGRSFGAPFGFGDPDRQAAHPAVLAVDQTVYLAWKEFDGDRSLVRLRISRDGGDTWEPARTLATDPGATDHPLLIADGGTAWLFWNSLQNGARLLPLEPPP